MSQNNERTLKLRCPHCFVDTDIHFAELASCKHCKKSLLNNRYIKPILGSGKTFLAALVIGLGGGSYLDDKFEENRYPIEEEYSIIERSLASEKPIRRDSLKMKKETCIKALIETQKEIDYDTYDKTPLKFISEYKRQIDKHTGRGN